MTKAPFRLAFRQEGTNWNVYMAAPDNMEDAVAIASIKIAFVRDPQIKEDFMELMRRAMEYGLKELMWIKPQWEEPQPAPEHERSEHG